MRAKRAVASISARVRKAHVQATRARMIASLSVAATVHYLPRPAQQGSAPQIGVEKGDVDPAGNQQQQPLQSVHVAVWGSGWHTAAHASLAAPLLLSLSPLEGPLVPVVLLPQAASPTVDDAPMTTMTWKSFSMFIKDICRSHRKRYIGAPSPKPHVNAIPHRKRSC